jgi:hypothetical protein
LKTGVNILSSNSNNTATAATQASSKDLPECKLEEFKKEEELFEEEEESEINLQAFLEV